jgi:cation:H+ antiporter
VTLWIIFVVSAGAVAGAGMRLARDGDTIAAGTGLGGLWVGAVLVAAATSMPELTTDVSAVWQGNASLAVGDLFGSSMANLAVLGVADLLTRHTRMLVRVSVNQALVALLGILLTTLAALGTQFPGHTLLGVGPGVWAIGLAYVAGMRMLHRNRGEPPFRTPSEVARDRPTRRELQRAVLGFGLAAVVIIVAAPFLADSTARLADRVGISHGVAGLILLALTTSLPEIAVSVTSIRAGSYDLAVGNLLGSNCFNMAALVALDLADGPGPVLGAIEPGLGVAALVGIVMTALAAIDVLNRAERRRWAVEPAPLLLLATYVVGVYLTYRFTAHAGRP